MIIQEQVFVVIMWHAKQRLANYSSVLADHMTTGSKLEQLTLLFTELTLLQEIW